MQSVNSQRAGDGNAGPKAGKLRRDQVTEIMPTKKPRNPDHVRRRSSPQALYKAITEHLQELLSPGIYSQSASNRSLGLRDRILTLPLMIAAVLTQYGSVKAQIVVN